MSDIALVTAISFILFMSTGVTGPISSLYAESLGASYVAIGLIGTVGSTTMIVSGYLWGRASDHLGQRRALLTASLATLALSYCGLSLAPHYSWLFPLRILGAVAQAGYGTTSLALMGDLLERGSDKRGRRMGVYRGLGSLGFGLMAFLSGRLADWFSLRVPYGLAAVLALVACAMTLRIREVPSPAKAPLVRLSPQDAVSEIWERVASLWQRGKSPDHGRSGPGLTASAEEDRSRLPMAPLLLSALLWSLATGAVYAVWANYMVSGLGYTPSAMSALWSLASTSEFPLMILAGWMSDRFGRLPVLSLAFLAWTFVFAGYVVVPMMPWIVLVQLVRGFAYSAYTATAMTYAAEVRSRRQRGQASGLYSSAGGLGSIMGSSLGGTLAQLAGFRTMIASNALLFLIGACYLAIVAVRWPLRARATVARELD